jgi:hypothetical protein
MTQMVSAERAAALRNKCLNLTKTCRLGSGSASERTSQSRQLMSPIGRFCSLIPGLWSRLSKNILAGFMVLSAVGACPPHDGVG